MIDNFGRIINYARISLIDRCNLKCIYCMPDKEVVYSDEKRLSSEDVLKIVKALAMLGIRKIRFTGGEPLLFKDIDKLIYETSRIHGIEDISITTNGTLLEAKAEELKKAGLKRLNINISSLNKDKYKSITRGGDLDRVLAGLDKAMKLGYNPIKINTVLIKGINDNEVQDFMNLTLKTPIDVRFIELMPIGEGKFYYDNGGKMSCEEIIESHSDLIKLESPRGSNANLYKLPNALGRIGFIEPISSKFCDECSKIRVTSYGSIKPCLHSREEINLMDCIDNEEELINILKMSILLKTKEHHLDKENTSRSRRQMFQIGG